MVGCALLLALQSASPTPTPSPPSEGPVILFLVDNSASLPPLDPEEKRSVALEKMFSFLQGKRYRMILFGGRREVFVDDVGRYRNNGQWTDFYFAFAKAQEIVKEYPEGTEFRQILITDGILDPAPEDWQDMNVPPGEELKAHVVKRTLDLIRELKLSLYVILVGDPPREGVTPGGQELAPYLILDMVRAANGAKASPLAQSLASFFKDDGALLKQFIYFVKPDEGLKKIEPVVRRIVAPARWGVELWFLTVLVLPLFLFLFLLLGILVRSFPGAGDVEVVELALGVPAHVGVDRLHRLQAGGWATTGLALVPDAKQAAATFTYQAASLDLTGAGLDAEGLDPLTARLLPMPLDELRRAVEGLGDTGTKEERIYVLNLDYMAKNFDAKEAERLLTASIPERRRIPALDFLRAKVHLLTNDSLRRRLIEPRVLFLGYGKDAERKELAAGMKLRVARYGFIVKDVGRGGRKDARVVLYYDRVPSLFGLKTWLPDFFQRAFRLRRSSQRIVTG
jgi:hypothetical protein